MVVLNIDVMGDKRSLYMDSRLYNDIQTKILPKIKKKDFDWVWVVDGPERSGKSVFAMQLAKILDPSFELSRVCMTPTDFTKAILKAKKGQCVIFDEAHTGLSSRASLTEINRLLVSLMMEMGQKNLFVIIVMPTIFQLDRYAALFRTKGLFHIYLKKGRRGRWAYFNSKKKKLLYLKGKKMFDYSFPKTKYRGRFGDQYVVDEKEYRKKKKDALSTKSRITKAETYKSQRDTLFWIMYKKLGLTQVKITRLCNNIGFKIHRTNILKILQEKEREILQEEALKEEEEEKEEDSA